MRNINFFNDHNSFCDCHFDDSMTVVAEKGDNS